MDNGNLSLPFFSRDQLDFGHGLTFKIRLVTQANVTGEITVTGATKEGKFTYKQTTTSNSQPITSDFSISDFPIFLSVSDSQGAFLQGQCRATITLLLDNDPMLVLCSGLVSNRKSISYPQTDVRDMIDGGGALVMVTTANPPVGTNLSQLVDTFAVWKLHAVSFYFATSAAVGNRQVVLKINNGFEVGMFFYSDIVQGPSQTKRYTFAAIGSNPTAFADNQACISIPADLMLRGNSNIGTSICNLKGGDNIGAAEILVEKFFV